MNRGRNCSHNVHSCCHPFLHQTPGIKHIHTFCETFCVLLLQAKTVIFSFFMKATLLEYIFSQSRFFLSSKKPNITLSTEKADLKKLSTSLMSHLYRLADKVTALLSFLHQLIQVSFLMYFYHWSNNKVRAFNRVFFIFFG